MLSRMSSCCVRSYMSLQISFIMQHFTECFKQDLACSVFNLIKIKCPSRSMRIIETGCSENRSPSKATVFMELAMSLHYSVDLIYISIFSFTGHMLSLYQYLYVLCNVNSRSAFSRAGLCLYTTFIF
jgi:hypothetical protein